MTRKIFQVLAATGFVLASTQAFAGTSVKATIVSPGGDPKLGFCLNGAPQNADKSCPNAISGSAQVSGKKGVQISLKGMTKPDATSKKDLLDNTATCNPTDVTAVDCYISTVSAVASGIPVTINLPTQIAKGKATIKLPITGALASPAFQGAALQLTGGATYTDPADKLNCGDLLSGAAYDGPVAAALLGVIGLTSNDVRGIFISGIAFDGTILDNPCTTGTLIGVAGIYNGN